VADLYYIEEDYYNPSLGYFVYIADAAAAIASSATMSVSGDKVVEAAASMSATFTQSASITHIKGVDLFAFTNAALAAEASRIRDGNISVSAVFSAAINVSRIVQVNADESAEFSFTTTVVRSRSFESVQSAAFSLAANNDRLRGGSSDVAAAFSLSATISHIEGADLTAFVNASLLASAISTRSANASLASQTALTASLGGTINAGAAFSVVSTLSSNARVNIRTTTVTEVGGAGFVTATIDTAIKKWGAGSLKWTIPSADQYPTSNIVWTGSQFKAFSTGFTWTSSNGTDWTRATNDLSSYSGHYITYANNNFVVYDDDGGKFKSSSNGTTWSDTTLTTSVWSNAFISKREVYYIGGYYHMFRVMVIGTTWTLVSYRSTSLTGSWARYDISSLIGDANLNGGGTLADIKLVGSTAYITVSFYDNFNAVYSRATQFTGPASPGAGWNILNANTGHLFVQKSSWDGSNDYLAHVVDSDDGAGYLYYKNASTTGNYSFNYTVADISYANGVWFIATIDGLYKTTAVDTAPTLVDIDIESEVQYQTSKYIALSNTYDGYVKTSTDSITWTYADIDPQVIPGSLTYSRGDNSDIGTFKTLDFWYYNVDSSTGSKFAFTQSATRYISFGTASTNYLEIQNVNGASTSNLAITETAILPLNTWTHIRLSIDGSNASLYVGGTRKATTGSWLGGVTAPLKIGGATSPAPVQYAAQFDEIFITDQLITAPSTTTFSVPTQAWNNSSTDVDLLLHFNTDFADDTAFFVDPSASLSATATLTASLTGTKTFASAMASQSTLTAVVGKLNEIVLTAFANASLTTTISKFTSFASSQSAAFSISAVNARTRATEFTAAVASTQTTEILRQRNIDINVSSQFGLVVNAVKQTINAASFTSAYQLALTAVKTVDVQLPLLSLFTPSIVVIAAKNAEIILQAATTLTANNLRTRESAVNLAGQFNQTVVISKIINATVTLNTAFNISATSSGIIEAIVFVTSQFTQQTTVLRTRFAQLTTSSNFGIVIDTFDSLAKTASANLVAVTNMIVVNARTRLGTVNISGVFSKLAVSVITTNSVLNVVINASMTTTVKKFSGVGVNLNVNSVMSITSSRILASAQIAVPITANITIDGTINILAQANLSAVTVMSVIGKRTRDIDLIINNFAVLSTNISRTRTSTAVYSMAVTMAVTINKLISTSATLVSTASFTAVNTRRRNGIVTLATSGAVLVVGKIIKIDTYVYEIPAETRIHIIASETRKYTIRSETRKHTIRRA